MRNEADDFETSDIITKALYAGDHFRDNENMGDARKPSSENIFPLRSKEA